MSQDSGHIFTSVPTADAVMQTLLRLIDRMDTRMEGIETSIKEVKESVLRLELTSVEARVGKLETTVQNLCEDYHRRQGSNTTLTKLADKLPWLAPIVVFFATYFGIKYVS